MIDQIIIGDKASFDDFGASVAGKELSQPKKKSIKETVPFSNITYDFTAIDGEIYWEDRELEYTFEIIASTAERLEEMKTAFASWVMNVMQQPLRDPIIPDYHFVVTYEDMSFNDDEGLEKTTASVTFTAYPYKIANYANTHKIVIPIRTPKTALILNKSSHRVTPTITADSAMTIELDGVSYSMGSGTAKDEAFKLNVGMNEVHIANSNYADKVFPDRAAGMWTEGGITFTYDGNGTFTANGTATEDVMLRFDFNRASVMGELWTLKCDGYAGDFTSYWFDTCSDDYGGILTDAMGGAFDFTVTKEGGNAYILMHIYVGTIVNNETFTPKLLICRDNNVTISFYEEVF